MKKERTVLSPEITRGLRDSFREEAQGKIPLLLRWKDLQLHPDEIVAQSMIIASARYLVRFEENVAQMPDAKPTIQKFIKEFTGRIADVDIMAPDTPFVYDHLFEWLLAGGVQAGEARYPYYEEFIPEFCYYLDKRNCFSPKYVERASPLLVKTPVELGYAVGRGLIPEWIKASTDY